MINVQVSGSQTYDFTTDLIHTVWGEDISIIMFLIGVYNEGGNEGYLGNWYIMKEGMKDILEK